MATQAQGTIDMERLIRSDGRTMNRKLWKQQMMTRLNINKTMNSIDMTAFGRAYIVFTRPDLNIFVDNKTSISTKIMNNAPQLYSAIVKNPAMAMALQSSTKFGQPNMAGNAGGFLFPLNNYCVTCNVPGMKLSLRAAAKNSKQYGISYGGDLYEALGETDIQIEFYENKDRDIQSLIEIWTLYIEAVSQGRIHPNPKYETAGIMDYMISAYIVVVDESNYVMGSIGLMSMFPISQNTNILNYKNGSYATEDFVGPHGYDFHVSYVTRPNDPIIYDNINWASGYGKANPTYNYNYKNSLNKRIDGGWTLHTGTPVYGSTQQVNDYSFNLEEKFADTIALDYTTLPTGVSHWTLLFLSTKLGSAKQ